MRWRRAQFPAEKTGPTFSGRKYSVGLCPVVFVCVCVCVCVFKADI